MLSFGRPNLYPLDYRAAFAFSLFRYPHCHRTEEDPGEFVENLRGEQQGVFAGDDVELKFTRESVGILGRANENRGTKNDSHCWGDS